MTTIAGGTPEQVADLIMRLPEFARKTTTEQIRDRMAANDSRIFLCEIDGDIGGFLVAYEEEPSVYYNWIMGVIPSFRRQGVASCLMEAFESFARTRGYESVRVRTMNQYRGMIHLLVARGYDITGFANDKITFERDAQHSDGRW